MKKNMHLIAFFAGSLLALTAFSQENKALTAPSSKAIHFKAFLNKAQKCIAYSEQSLTAPQAVPQLDSSYKWSWDPISVNWALNKKVLDFTYDAQGNTTGNRLQNYTGSGWENSQLFSSSYDDYHPLVFTYKTWNGNTWGNDHQIIFTYDANGNETSDVTQKGNADKWENVNRHIYIYDANLNQVSGLDQVWDGTQWENKTQYFLTYDANNQPTEETDQIWNNGAWENDMHYSVIYDASYNILQQLDESWNGTAWENANRYTYTYDANNNALTELDENWENAKWVNTDYYTYAYDANGNETSEILQNWINSDWANSQKIIYTFKTNNFISAYVIHEWDPVQNDWLETNRVSYEYNASNKITAKTNEKKDGASWLYTSQTKNGYNAHDVLISNAFRYYDDDGITVVFGDSTYYFIHDKTSSLAETDLQKNIHVFPNPSSGAFHIVLDNPGPFIRVEVYNALGERILEQRQSASLFIPEATKGMYYIKVYDGDHLYNEKMIIQ